MRPGGGRRAALAAVGRWLVELLWVVAIAAAAVLVNLLLIVLGWWAVPAAAATALGMLAMGGLLLRLARRRQP